MNRFDAIEYFYGLYERDILTAPRNEWAIDPNAFMQWFDMTPIENWLWGDIREANIVMYPQWPVAGFFVDFANPVARLAIECDGKAWHLDKEKDAARDAKLRALGWEVVRLTGSQCRMECDEETGDPAYPLRLMRSLGERYGIKRNAKGAVVEVFDAMPGLIDRILLQNDEAH